MRILTLTCVAAALAMTLTPAAHAQENTSRVRQAYLRAQARQQEVRQIERFNDKANAWIAQRDNHRKRAAWVAESLPKHDDMPAQRIDWRQDVMRVGATMNMPQDRAAWKGIRGAKQMQRDPALNSMGDSSTPLTRPMVRRLRWAQTQSQTQDRAPKRSTDSRMARQPAKRHAARAERAMTDHRAPAAPRRVIRTSKGRNMHAADQPSTRPTPAGERISRGRKR